MFKTIKNGQNMIKNSQKISPFFPQNRQNFGAKNRHIWSLCLGLSDDFNGLLRKTSLHSSGNEHYY